MKGSLADVLTMMVVFMAFIFITFVANIINTNTHEAFNNATTLANITNSNVTSVIDQSFNDSHGAINAFTAAIPFLTIGTGLGAIVLAFFIPASPIFLPVSVFLLVVYEVLAAIFANVMYVFINDTVFVGIANDNPILVLLIEKMPLWVGVVTIVLMIVMYSKQPTGEPWQ